MKLVRAYHAVLAVLATLAFLSGDFGLIHAWLGYGVGIIIVLRLLAARSGERTLGLQKFYPQFEGLRLDTAFTHPAVSRVILATIALCLLGVTATGIALDGGRAIGLADAAITAPAPIGTAYADSQTTRHPPRSPADRAVKELHEGLGNILMLGVGLHVAYLFAFRRPLARFMLFLPPTTRK